MGACYITAISKCTITSSSNIDDADKDNNNILTDLLCVINLNNNIMYKFLLYSNIK